MLKGEEYEMEIQTFKKRKISIYLDIYHLEMLNI